MDDELEELLKGFLARLDTEGAPQWASEALPPPIETAGQEPSWVEALRWCPRELLDLINSKACRGSCFH